MFPACKPDAATARLKDMQYFLACLFLTIGSSIPRACFQDEPAERFPIEATPRHKQAPIMNIPLPGFGGGKDSSPDTGDVIISDVIGKDRAINIFAGFTRDIASISERLNDDGCNSTVLAPLNSEIQKLPRKPWEDPKDYGALGQGAYDGSAGEDRAHRNLRRFVEAHILPASPWKAGEKIRSVGGEELWWEDKKGTRTVCGITTACLDYR